MNTAGGVKKSECAARLVTGAPVIWRFFFVSWAIGMFGGGVLTLFSWALDCTDRALSIFRNNVRYIIAATSTRLFSGIATIAPPRPCGSIIFHRLALLARQPVAVRREALALLDQISRPLSVREIEHSLRDAGVSKSERVKLAGSLKGLSIVAIVRTPDEHEDPGQ